jgi:hypothetical protein
MYDNIWEQLIVANAIYVYIMDVFQVSITLPETIEPFVIKVFERGVLE